MRENTQDLLAIHENPIENQLTFYLKIFIVLYLYVEISLIPSENSPYPEAPYHPNRFKHYGSTHL